MNTHNLSIPPFKCLVAKSHFTKDDHDATFIECVAFGVQSVQGKILTFHVMTDSGIQRARVPISAIYTYTPTQDVPYDFKQLWDCFGSSVSYTCFEYLSGKRCSVMLKDKTLSAGRYMFTIDWFDNAYSNEPTDYKCGHVIAADAGYLLCQPNNRIQWFDPNFIVKPFDFEGHKVDTQLLSVEECGRKWVSESTDSFFYDVHRKDFQD